MKHSRPDGFYGSMLAAESIIDGMTILHGPGGCRGLAASYASR
jgi:nitrogenase molybdenum-iron protein alpha/beta subunit